MEETIRSNDLILNAEKVCKSIRVYRKLLKRSNDEDWHSDLQTAITERKWGKIIYWEPCRLQHSKEDFEVRPGVYRWYFLTAPKKVLEEGTYLEFKKARLKAYKRGEKKADEDLRKALKVFRKYNKTWWD